MRCLLSLLVVLGAGLALVAARPHYGAGHIGGTRGHHGSHDGVLSEFSSSSIRPAIPGEQCFSSNEKLEKNGEENNTVYSYKSFCEQSVEGREGERGNARE
jgi:hypothetical protein